MPGDDGQEELQPVLRLRPAGRGRRHQNPTAGRPPTPSSGTAARGRQFWVVSAHLDNRHGSKANDAKFSRLRVRQAAAVVSRLARLNRDRTPGRFRWRHQLLVDRPQRVRARTATCGPRAIADTVSAPTRINHLYPTVNHWRTTLKKTKNGVRLDVVMAKGARGATRWENKMSRVDRARPSDHNMVLADIRL